MEEKIIETCLCCFKKELSFERRKNTKYTDIYLKICYDCPYKTEFMILSGNNKSELPLDLKNIYQIIDTMKSGNVYNIEKTTRKINVFLTPLKIKTNTEFRYNIIFKFIKFLTWSDKLKHFVQKLQKEVSVDFINSLTKKKNKNFLDGKVSYKESELDEVKKRFDKYNIMVVFFNSDAYVPISKEQFMKILIKFPKGGIFNYKNKSVLSALDLSMNLILKEKE